MLSTVTVSQLHLLILDLMVYHLFGFVPLHHTLFQFVGFILLSSQVLCFLFGFVVLFFLFFSIQPCYPLQVDELYEAYCIQRRLCDGASKMKQAFAMSPASKAARESLTEINRSYKEYTEVHLL